MNIFILTQEDAFYIPKMLKRFLKKLPNEIQVTGASILKGEIAIENVYSYYQLLGLSGFILNGFDFVRYKLLDIMTNFINMEGVFSVKGAFKKGNINVYDFESINSSDFHSFVKENNIDLIISIACPQIIKKELIDLPPKGIINIHGALLPKYRGKLPSFWVLLNEEERTGVTVHYVNEDLDDGPIIAQKEVEIKENDTMHSLILRSKVKYGADALAEAVKKISGGDISTKPNLKEEATYISFPDREAIKRFKNKGNKVR